MLDLHQGTLRSPAPAAPNYQLPTGLGGVSWRAMGTTIFMAVPAEYVATGAERAAHLFADWEQCLSRFLPESELSQLNRAAGTPVAVSDLMWRVLTTALEAARASHGMYDPTLGQQMLRIGYDRSFSEIAGRQLDTVREAPLLGGGWQGLRLDATRHMVTAPTGVTLDFGGIAKGMAVDAAITMLREMGYEPALINAGGDLAVLGAPTPTGWSLAVPGVVVERTIMLRGGALATSSIGQRAWQQGSIARHHLIDPRTGEPVANGVWAVTAAARTCAQAEVAAKVALILGAEAGMAFLTHWGIAGQVVMADGRILTTAGWPSPGNPTDE